LLSQATDTPVWVDGCRASSSGLLPNHTSNLKYFECFMFMVVICIHMWSEGKRRAGCVCLCLAMLHDKEHQDS